ncbi:hypothetical protein NDU88_007159 [Pleurodeles waltl]|uniref:Uncharacterized protein n=2 Tax=Pleurodeles waltl TaxID=8319 RepID=A0AAV7VT05_PLEWA|nr:hypothetical protein NDU88_007159 [Pleurodeles waltl]
MVQNHEQAQRESRKVKSANRQLQLSIKKVVKSCQDIGTRIASMETRTEELETEVRAATAQTTTQGQQISDIQWKLEDAENRQRRNNLRILGIAEDLEGITTVMPVRDAEIGTPILKKGCNKIWEHLDISLLIDGSGIQDGGWIFRLIATTVLAHPLAARGSHSPATKAVDSADTARLQHGPLAGSFPMDRGREGKHRRAPQEESSAALVPEPHSSSFRPSATLTFFGGSSWRVGRSDGTDADQDPSLLTGTAESRPRRN